MRHGVTKLQRVQEEALHIKNADFAKYEEEQRLEVLHRRALRQKLILQDTLKEQEKIKMRILRRKRRALGKT